MSYEPPFTINTKIINLVSLISEKIGGMSLSKKEPFKLRKISRIKTLAGTLQIEGSTLDEEKITALLEGKRVLATEREVAEAKGAIELYNTMQKLDYKSQKDLLKSHKILMQELLEDNGKYRKSNVGVGSQNGVTHVAPPHDRVYMLMDDLFEWLKKTDIHPLLSSSIFHYEFEFIHPFSDGNGRMGRFWQSLILYNYKEMFAYIPIEGMVRQKQNEYYKALENSGSRGESTPFVEYMLDVILETLKELEKENIPNNAQQTAQQTAQQILDEIKIDKFITIKQLSVICKLGTRTVQKIINELKEEDKLKRVGSNKGGYWEIIK
ncbi:MAG: Fic family protein [Sulfurimonas sp.]|jgi:Fic family protein